MPAASLVTTAGLVRVLGPRDFGVLVIALAVSALSLAINPAIAATTTKFVAETRVGGPAAAPRTARVVTASLLAVMALGTLLLVLAALTAQPLARFLFGAALFGARADLGGVLLLAVLSVCIQQLDSVFAAAIKGLERFKEQAVFELCSRFAVAGAAIAVAWLTHDIRAVLLAMCAVFALSALARGLLLSLWVPRRRIFAHPSRSEVRQLLAFGGWMWLNGVATVAYGTVDRLIVGRFLGATAAAQFQVYVQVAQLCHYLPANVFAFAFPVFSRVAAGGAAQRPALERLYRRLFAVIVVSALVLGAGFVLLRQPVMSLFAGKGLPSATDPTLLLLIAAFVVLAVNIAPYYLLLAMGQARAASLVTSFSVLLCVGLAWVLVPRLGMEGAAIGRIGYALGSLALLGLAHRVLRKPGLPAV